MQHVGCVTHITVALGHTGALILGKEADAQQGLQCSFVGSCLVRGSCRLMRQLSSEWQPAATCTFLSVGEVILSLWQTYTCQMKVYSSRRSSAAIFDL